MKTRHLALLLALLPLACMAERMLPIAKYGTQQDNHFVTPMVCSGTPGVIVPAGAGDVAHIYWFPAESGGLSRVRLPVPVGSQGFLPFPDTARVAYWSSSSVARTVDFATVHKNLADGQWQLSLDASLPMPTNLIRPRILAVSPTNRIAIVSSSISGSHLVYLLRAGHAPTLISDMDVADLYFWTPCGFLSVRWSASTVAIVELWDPEAAVLLASTNLPVDTYRFVVGTDDAWYISSNALRRLSLPALQVSASLEFQADSLNGIASRGAEGVAVVTDAPSGRTLLLYSRDGELLYGRPTSLSWNLHLSVDGRFVSDGEEILDIDTGSISVMLASQPYVGADFLTATNGSIFWCRANFWSDDVEVFRYQPSWPVQPLVVALARHPDRVECRFISQTNYSYRLQTASNLTGNCWCDASIVGGSGGVQVLSTTNAAVGSRYLRLVGSAP